MSVTEATTNTPEIPKTLKFTNYLNYHIISENLLQRK